MQACAVFFLQTKVMRLPVLSQHSGLRYFTFFYLYVMQGVPAGFALTALSNYLQGQHVRPEKVGTFIALVGLPWTIQFIWGPLIDRFQFSQMGHRKHWVVLSQWLAIIASFCLFLVKDPVTELNLLGAVFFIHSVFASIQDASVDAIAISVAPVKERGRINGFMRGGFLLGMAFGAAVLSIVLHNFDFRTAVFVQLTVLITFSLIFFFTKLEPTDRFLFPHFSLRRNSTKGSSAETTTSNPAIRSLFERIYSGITNKTSLQYFGAVAWIYFTASIFIRSYTFHLITVLKWSDKSVSLLQGGWGSIITFIAILIAGIASDRIGPKKMQIYVMWGICLFLMSLSACYVYWSNPLFSGTALVIWNFADPLLSVSVFPILMGLCLEKVEGSQFTAYLALVNLCDVLGSFLTGWLLSFISAPLLCFICGSSLLLLLLLIRKRGTYITIPDSSKDQTITHNEGNLAVI